MRKGRDSKRGMVHPASRIVEKFYWLWSIPDDIMYSHAYDLVSAGGCLLGAHIKPKKSTQFTSAHKVILAVPHH